MLLILSFGCCYLSECPRHRLFEAVTHSEGLEEPSKVELGHDHFRLYVLWSGLSMQRMFSDLLLLVHARCKCNLLSSIFDPFILEGPNFFFWQVWAYELGILSRPSFNHPPECGFPRLPQWIRRTTSLIESFAEVRGLLTRLTHDQV